MFVSLVHVAFQESVDLWGSKFLDFSRPDSLSLYLALFWYHFTKCFQSGADAATAESELLGVIAEFWSRVAAHARDTQPKPATGFPRPIFFDTFVQFFVFGISHAVHCGMVRVFPKSEATVATDFVRDRICAETYRLIGGYELAPATLRTMSERAFPTPIPIEVRLPFAFVAMTRVHLARY